MSDQEYVVNESVDFVVGAVDDSTIRKLSTYEKVKDGYYGSVIVAAKRVIGKSKQEPGCPTIELQLKMLADADDCNSGVGDTQRTWISLPLPRQGDNKIVCASRNVSTARSFLCAVMPGEIVDAPRRNEAGQTEFMGSVLHGSKAYATALAQANKSLNLAATKLWNDNSRVEDLKGQRVFVRVKNSVSKISGATYTNFSRFAADADPSEVLANGEDMFFIPDGGDDASIEVPEIG